MQEQHDAASEEKTHGKTPAPGLTVRRSRRKWRWLRSRERRPWSIWHRISTYTRTRSSNGGTNFWKGATGAFGETPKGDPDPKVDVKTLTAKIGELTLENVFCPARDALHGERHRSERNARLSLSRQASVLGISRSSIHDQPQPVGDADLKLMPRFTQAQWVQAPRRSTAKFSA